MDDGRKTNQNLPLSEALGLQKREMISLTGAGGKTTLMFRLAGELFLQGKKVITTTTTKILEPSKNETSHLFVSRDEERIKEFVDRHIDEYGHITLAGEKLDSGKLKGLSSSLLNILWNLCEIDAMIIEADGAAGRPVKAPREGEPIIPSNTTLVAAVLGLEGVGKELNDRNVFQAERVSKLTGIPEGEKMTEEGMALLMTHPEGLFKGAPNSSRLVTFLNKADISNGLNKGRRIAHLIFEKSHSRIERVISGQLKNEPPIAEVFFP
ncbi:MAG: putative selenium-dependent hydroxylase accessory protein YqeC [Deltaproteobacteria bacterium]|nr:putative selenium-dependent hydroxylase accessory protein YqeC [Deltaproteobacteria bacterium]